MNRKSIALSLLPFLMIVFLEWYPVQAAPPPGMTPHASTAAMAVPTVLKSSPELGQLVKKWDNESALAIEVQRQAPRQVLNRAAMRRIQVDTGTGKQADLGSLYDHTFAAQREMGRQRAPRRVGPRLQGLVLLCAPPGFPPRARACGMARGHAAHSTSPSSSSLTLKSSPP